MAHSEPIFETAGCVRGQWFQDDLHAFVAYRADPDVARFQSWRDYTLDEGRAR